MNGDWDGLRPLLPFDYITDQTISWIWVTCRLLRYCSALVLFRVTEVDSSPLFSFIEGSVAPFLASVGVQLANNKMATSIENKMCDFDGYQSRGALSSHFTQFNWKPINRSRPSAVNTHGRFTNGGLCRMCWLWRHSSFAIQTPSSSWSSPKNIMWRFITMFILLLFCPKLATNLLKNKNYS